MEDGHANRVAVRSDSHELLSEALYDQNSYSLTPSQVHRGVGRKRKGPKPEALEGSWFRAVVIRFHFA